MRVVQEVTAMERAGAQINANDGEAVGRRDGEGLCFQTKTLPERRSPASLSGRGAAQEPPGGPRSPSALQSAPLSRPWVSPPSTGRGRRRWHRLLRRGTNVPTAACGRNAQLWGGGQRIQCGGRLGPLPPARPRPCPLQGCAAPPPSPQLPRPAAQGPEGRGRPPLVVHLEGKEGRRGEKPKVGLAEGLPGNSTTLA